MAYLFGVGADHFEPQFAARSKRRLLSRRVDRIQHQVYWVANAIRLQLRLERKRYPFHRGADGPRRRERRSVSLNLQRRRPRRRQPACGLRIDPRHRDAKLRQRQNPIAHTVKYNRIGRKARTARFISMAHSLAKIARRHSRSAEASRTARPTRSVVPRPRENPSPPRYCRSGCPGAMRTPSIPKEHNRPLPESKSNWTSGQA